MTETFGSKLVRELRQLLLVAFYFYVCLLSLLLYASTVAGDQHIAFVHFGYAALKALVLAKFVLLGHWLRLGDRNRNRRLIYSVIYQTLALGALLVVLSLIEQFVEGIFHGHSIAAGVAALQLGAFRRILAQSLILFLVLLPYVALRQLSVIMGSGKLREFFLGMTS